jgi:polyisoprenoid-binding protein YceI
MPRLAGRPRKRVVMVVLGGGVAAAVAAFLLVYFVLFPTSSPKPFKLSATPAATTSSSAASTSGSTTQSTSTSALAGSWKVASGSEAGYRVREKLGFLPAESDAVGRTSQMTGNATLTESGGKVTIHAASFNVAVDTLKSDRSMRDEKIHEIGLESSRYPTASFALSTPVTVSASAIKGKVARVQVTGTFTIHGTSKTEALPVEMSISGSTFQAAGALTFPWSEFGMTAPSIGGFVNVTGKATMEFDLRLQRA